MLATMECGSGRHGMSFLHAAPEALAAAASDVAGIGSTISAANAAAALPTTGPLAAAADEVSAQVAAVLSRYAQGYQQLSAQMAAFHDQFVLALKSGANSYAAAEAGAAQSLASTLNAPGAALSQAASSLQNALLGGGAAPIAEAASQASALALRPTGGLAAATALLQPAASTAAASAAILPMSIGTAIENLYLTVEPWVQYGFLLASYAAGWLPFVGLLAPQINFFYSLFEPMVQSALFNTIDWLEGSITFSQGLSNFWTTTTASINQFINTEINWVRSFFPPLPPLP